MSAKESAIATRGEVVEQDLTTVVDWNLDQFPVAKFNRLIPTQTIAMPTDLFRPIVQVVQLDVELDTYKSNDVPNGNKALNRVALRKLATAAGISFLDERRTDDGTNPDVCEVTCLAEMTLPTGQRIRATGMKRVDLSRQSWASAAQRAKYASFFQEHVASRAENRAIRALLSLQASYPLGELAKPFAVVSFAPNMQHPEVRARFLDAMAPAAAQLFGPSASPQLAAGAPVAEAPMAADDDGDPGPGAQRSGSAAADGDPDWFAPTAGEAKTETKATVDNWLPETLRRRATESGVKGAATDPQRQQLRTILRPLGREVVEQGLAHVFGLTDMGEISGAQAQAIINVETDTVSEEFLDLWRDMVGAQAAA